MASNFSVARPYAKAIFTIALANNKLPHWSQTLMMLAFIAKDSRIEALLSDPRISWHERAALFTDICGKALDAKGKNLVQILAMNRRLIILPEIAEFYEKLFGRQQNIVKAKIKSAMTIDKTQQEKLQKAIEKRLQTKIEAQYAIDDSLLGGVTIRIGDRVIDGSVRGQLEQLDKSLRG
jgi:F-type H+-transporting ATPase subunit delta